jgi:hypothetical protein
LGGHEFVVRAGGVLVGTGGEEDFHKIQNSTFKKGGRWRDKAARESGNSELMSISEHLSSEKTEGDPLLDADNIHYLASMMEGFY